LVVGLHFDISPAQLSKRNPEPVSSTEVQANCGPCESELPFTSS
jgi:hypothetical protein